MKRLLVACFAVTVSPALAVDVESRIDAVTVYATGAIVTRIATLDLPAGTTTIRLPGLVDDIDPMTIRAEVDAPGVQLGQVRYNEEPRREAFNAEVERLNAAVRDAEARLAAIDDAIRSAELKLKFLDSLAQGYAQQAWHESAGGSADVGSWREALSLLHGESAGAYADIRGRRAARVEAERDLSVLQRELAELRGAALASSVVELAMSSERAQSVRLRLHYGQDDAYWQPSYEARLASDEGRLTLTQQAVVEQDTGEAWTNVVLSLSTSDPGGALAPADVDSEFLELGGPLVAAPMPARMSAADNVLEEITVTGSKAGPRVGRFAVTYDIPGRVTVDNAADDTQAFDVATMTTPVRLVTRVVPRESERAYLAARFEYSGTLPLYESDMRVFVDGAYAGETTMPTALPGAELLLPMGDDRRIEIRVTDRGRERGESGIISRRREETADYLFEIVNRHSRTALVEVVDRYPVARHRDIEVTVPRDASEPDERDVDEKPGVILWRRELGAGDSWRIEHGYTIDWPADGRLVRR